MAKTKDLTKGSIGKTLILFAVPLLISSLVQQLYNTVDLIFAGNYINRSASAAIGASSLLITCLVGFFGGMSVGTGVVVSRYFGAKNLSKVKKALHNAVFLSMAGGLLFLLIGELAVSSYLRLVNTPETILEMAAGYLRVYTLSFVPMFVFNLGSGVLRALGNSRAPLCCQLLGGLMNVAMDYLFLRLFENGVTGVAWATLISQTTAAAAILYSLSRLDEQYAFRWASVAPDRELLIEVIRIGVPAGTQSLVITLSNVMAQYHINSLGEDAIAAFAAYFQVELIIYLPIVAFGQAVMTFSGQNAGANRFDRVRRGTGVCLLISMSLAVVSSAAALHLGPYLFRAFNRETAVIETGCRIIGITFPFYCIYCILQVLGDSLRGCGQTRQPMYIILINICVIRTILLFSIVPRIGDVRGVAAAYPVTWALTAVCMAVYYCRYHFRRTGTVTWNRNHLWRGNHDSG